MEYYIYFKRLNKKEMKKKYFTPEMEEMIVETPTLLEKSSETGSDKACLDKTTTCTDDV